MYEANDAALTTPKRRVMKAATLFSIIIQAEAKEYESGLFTAESIDDRVGGVSKSENSL